MEETLTLAEILASIVRRGKGIIICSLALAILAGCYQGYRQRGVANNYAHSVEAIEKQYQEEIERYEEQKAFLGKKLADAERKVANQKEYIERSPYMAIDPSGMYVSKIQLTVSDLDDGAFQQVSREQDIPVDYLMSRILSGYQIAWDSADLPAVLGLSEYENVSDGHLREVLLAEKTADGMLTITAYGTTAQGTEVLAQAAYRWLLRQQKNIAEATFEHQLAMVVQTTKAYVDQNWAKRQGDVEATLVVFTSSANDIATRLEQLTEPSRGEAYSSATAVKEVIKYMVIGGAAGLFISCAWVFALGLFRNRLEVSYQMVRCFGFAYMGNIAPQANLFAKLASRMANERIWKDSPSALKFAAESIKTRLDEKRSILFLSTQELDKTSAVEELAELLNADKIEVDIKSDTRRNANAISSMMTTALVIVVEKIGKSSMKEIQDLKSMVENTGNAVGGFILI